MLDKYNNDAPINNGDYPKPYSDGVSSGVNYWIAFEAANEELILDTQNQNAITIQCNNIGDIEVEVSNYPFRKVDPVKVAEGAIGQKALATQSISPLPKSGPKEEYIFPNPDAKFASYGSNNGNIVIVNTASVSQVKIIAKTVVDIHIEMSGESVETQGFTTDIPTNPEATAFIREKYFYVPDSGVSSISGMKIGAPVLRLSEAISGGNIAGRYDFDQYMTPLASVTPNADLIPGEEERIVATFSIELSDTGVISLADNSVSGSNILTGADLSGVDVLANIMPDYDISYARIKLLANEKLRKNSFYGEEDPGSYNGHTGLDESTAFESRFREDSLGYFRVDGNDPSTSDETIPQEIQASRGGIRLDGPLQIQNFRMIANTIGFDAADTHHHITVSLYIGRTPNF